MRAPSERADDMTEALHGLKRRIERRPANRIVDHLKAAAAGVLGDVALDSGPIVVDRDGAELFDEGQASRRARREHLGPDGPRQLDRDVADAARAAMDQHGLAWLQACAIDQAFPCG